MICHLNGDKKDKKDHINEYINTKKECQLLAKLGAKIATLETFKSLSLNT